MIAGVGLAGLVGVRDVVSCLFGEHGWWERGEASDRLGASRSSDGSDDPALFEDPEGWEA